MNNTELLNTVESTAEQTEGLVNIANISTELSEEQLNNVNGGKRVYQYFKLFHSNS
jgi:bacteriocin-like protein